MITDPEVSLLCNELFGRFMKGEDANTSFYAYTLESRVESKLYQLSNALDQAQRELEIEKNKTMVWKESYMNQIKENVKMQADQLAKPCNCTASWYIDQFARVSKENEELRNKYSGGEK